MNDLTHGDTVIYKGDQSHWYGYEANVYGPCECLHCQFREISAKMNGRARRVPHFVIMGRVNAWSGFTLKHVPAHHLHSIE